ncbi:MAG: CopG family transcriptional regulator [Thermoanaerobaculia bacterium]|nr:CopG family transcriptional regulator [Thermoanaerobaculia bacterium]
MAETTKRATIYFDPEVHRALRFKAAAVDRPMSELVNEAVRRLLEEDREDLGAFEIREAEPTLSYEELLDDLKANGKL